MSEILSIFGINWKLLLVQAVNFGVLVGVLWYFLYHPLLRLIAERQQKIEDGVKNAEAADRRLKEIEDSRSGALEEAVRKAEALVAEGKERAKAEEAALVREAHEKSTRILSDAKARAEEAKRAALEESNAEIARLAVLGVERILRSNVK